MTAELLNVLVGAAVTDRDFCQALLTNPGSTARRFGLEPEDVEALSGIRARSLSEFAGQLLNWMPRESREMRYATAR
jgi:hypothetical protein